MFMEVVATAVLENRKMKKAMASVDTHLVIVHLVIKLGSTFYSMKRLFQVARTLVTTNKNQQQVARNTIWWSWWSQSVSTLNDRSYGIIPQQQLNSSSNLEPWLNPLFITSRHLLNSETAGKVMKIVQLRIFIRIPYCKKWNSRSRSEIHLRPRHRDPLQLSLLHPSCWWWKNSNCPLLSRYIPYSKQIGQVTSRAFHCSSRPKSLLNSWPDCSAVSFRHAT